MYKCKCGMLRTDTIHLIFNLNCPECGAKPDKFKKVK